MFFMKSSTPFFIVESSISILRKNSISTTSGNSDFAFPATKTSPNFSMVSGVCFGLVNSDRYCLLKAEERGLASFGRLLSRPEPRFGGAASFEFAFASVDIDPRPADPDPKISTLDFQRFFSVFYVQLIRQ